MAGPSKGHAKILASTHHLNLVQVHCSHRGSDPNSNISARLEWNPMPGIGNLQALCYFRHPDLSFGAFGISLRNDCACAQDDEKIKQVMLPAMAFVVTAGLVNSDRDHHDWLKLSVPRIDVFSLTVYRSCADHSASNEDLCHVELE